MSATNNNKQTLADYELKIDEILTELTKICEQNKQNAKKNQNRLIEPPMMYGDLYETIDHWVKNRPAGAQNVDLIYVDTIEWLYTGTKSSEKDISKNVFGVFRRLDYIIV